MGAHTSSVTATYRNGIHPRQRSDRRRTAKDQHRRHNDICSQPEEHEHQMGDGAPAGGDDLQPGVRVWGIELELRGKLCRDSDTIQT